MNDFQWIPPYGKDRGAGSIGDLVSHMDGVRFELQSTAVKIFTAAQAELLVHRRTGEARIRIEGAPPHKLDWYVLLEVPDKGGIPHGPNVADRTAMAIEFGWTQTHAFGKKLRNPVKHEGLHILRNAMGRA